MLVEAVGFLRGPWERSVALVGFGLVPQMGVNFVMTLVLKYVERSTLLSWEIPEKPMRLNIESLKGHRPAVTDPVDVKVS